MNMAGVISSPGIPMTTNVDYSQSVNPQGIFVKTVSEDLLFVSQLIKSTLTTPNTSESPTSSEGTTTSMITTGQPVGECFTTGSCDILGGEHIGTVYGISDAESCQQECVAGNCNFFTWYQDSEKCRLFSECLPSGEMC